MNIFFIWKHWDKFGQPIDTYCVHYARKSPVAWSTFDRLSSDEVWHCAASTHFSLSSQFHHQNKSGNNSTHLEVPIAGFTCCTFFGRTSSGAMDLCIHITYLCVIDGARFRISRRARTPEVIDRSIWITLILLKSVLYWVALYAAITLFAAQDQLTTEGFAEDAVESDRRRTRCVALPAM